jgi:hypothetical protein
MPAKSKVTEAPYTEDGSLMHFPEDRYDYSGAVRLQTGFGWKTPPRTVGPDWHPNVPFAATLRLAETRRGRSAAYFIWRSDDDREFPMFISDMLALVQSGVTIADGGVVTTRWMVTKRGANYGIRHAVAEESDG